MVTFGGLLCRRSAAQDTRLSRQVGALTADVRQVNERLSHRAGWIAGGTGRSFPERVQTREGE